MRELKSNTRPFWSLVILFIIVLAIRLAGLITISNYYTSVLREDQRYLADEAISSLLWQMIVVLVVISVEACLYWLLRRRLLKPAWVRIHIILLYFAFVGIPILYYLAIIILPRYFGGGNYREVSVMIGWIQAILSWSSIIIGHFFFVLTIVYGLRARKLIEPVQNESAHILDEFNK